MGKTKRRLSNKAITNNLAIRKQNIQRNIRKFNKLVSKADSATFDEETKELLTNIYLDITADLEIIEGLDPKSTEISQLKEQVQLMEKYVKSDSDRMSQTDSDRASQPSAHSRLSKSSVRLAAGKIRAAEVDAEIEALRQQLEDERILKDLENKLHAQKQRMRENALISKKQQISHRNRLLEEHDIDERDDILDVLENDSIAHASPARANSIVSQPPRNSQILTVNQQAVDNASVRSNVSDNRVLADSITQAMRSTRMPIPEPPVFEGDPLEYVDWEVAFRTLIESSGIPDSDKIHYLKKYVSGKAKEAISGAFLLRSDSAYEAAKKKLKERFGSDYAIAEAFRSKLQKWPKIKGNEHALIQQFADFLSQCETAMAQIEELRILNDSQQNVMLRGKLPEWLANRWKRKVVQFRKLTADIHLSVYLYNS